MTPVEWQAERSRVAMSDCSLTGPDLRTRLPWEAARKRGRLRLFRDMPPIDLASGGMPAQMMSEPGAPRTVLSLSVASAIRRRGEYQRATLSTESTLRATWYRSLSWCSDRVGE